MRLLFIFSFLIYHFNTFAQCSYCPTIKEASMFPDQAIQLNLKYTSFTTLDSSINQFKNLREIDLSRSFIRNFNPGIYSPTLNSLNLSNTLLDPWEFEKISSGFPNLKRLDINSSNLRFLPNKLGNLDQLTHLDLSNNRLTHIPEELENFQNLTHLDLSNNNLLYPSSSIGFLWKLENLNISGNPKLDLSKILTSISENKSLKELNIDAYSLSKDNGKLLSSLPITTLKLHSLNSQNQGFIRNIPSLKQLEIDEFSGNDIDNLFSRFTGINHLVISNSFMTQEFLQELNIDTLTLKSVGNINSGVFKSIKRIDVLDLTQSLLSNSDIEELKAQLPKTTIISSIYGEYDYKALNNGTPIVEIPTKTFVHNSNEQEVIREKNATLEIPENAFLLDDGSIYNGPVNIEVKVYEDAIELALDNAPMNYSANGNNEIFGSNGMLYFNATTQNGEQLNPNPEAIINVEMRNNIPGNTGLMYIYDSTQQNWSPLPSKVITSNSGIDFQRIVDSVNAIDASKLIRVVNNDRRYNLKITSGKYDLPILEFDSQFTSVERAPSIFYLNRFNEVGKEFCKHSWVIDTVISPETLAFLKQVQKETRIKKKDLKNEYKPFFPKVIWNLSLTPDYVNDNYRLLFNVRDSFISLPVALSGESNNRIQRQHLELQKKLRKAEKRDSKSQELFDKYYKKHIDKAIQDAQELIIQNTIANLTGRYANSEMINFGLTGFGLVNCDIFVRLPPEDYLVVSDKLNDQHGNTLKAPNEIKIVLQEQNSYFTTKRDNVPVYTDGIAFVILDENKKLGFIPINTSANKLINTITVHDISNLTPEQISQLIANQYAQN